jgi:hypothetical protein
MRAALTRVDLDQRGGYEDYPAGSGAELTAA